MRFTLWVREDAKGKYLILNIFFKLTSMGSIEIQNMGDVYGQSVRNLSIYI